MVHECVIVGGGPAGLTAAIYLARFLLSIRPYDAGTVVLGLDQISNAMGMAGVAATKIRNLLDERRPIRR